MELNGSLRIWQVLEGDSIKLALVDVGDSVVLSPLTCGNRCLQKVSEAVLIKPETDIYISHQATCLNFDTGLKIDPLFSESGGEAPESNKQ